MHAIRIALFAAHLLLAPAALAGEAEIRAAQGTIEAQLRAFQADDPGFAYSLAAPNIKRLFPTVEMFMQMVESGYQPVRNPRNYSFGKAEEMGATTIAQQVLLTGPDGKEYEALYQLQRQPDGMFRIIGVSLKAANTIGA